MLAAAPHALYLREPVTQSDPDINRRIVFRPDLVPELEPKYKQLADKAFRGGGVPDFAEKVVRLPERWRMDASHSRHLVIKEVNPMAAGWFLRRYRPRIVFLLRHPAATAWSSRKQEWLGPTIEDWASRGRETAEAWIEAHEALKDHPDCCIVTHESLCLDPLGGFKSLYDFAGLTWTDDVAATISTYSQDSKSTIGAWRTEAPPDCVNALGDEYLRFNLEWYRGDEEW
jgi:hypothetical protein